MYRNGMRFAAESVATQKEELPVMTKHTQEKLLVNIPFCGFYETYLSEMPDQNLTYILDDAPVELAREVWDLIIDTRDYRKAYLELSKLYCKHFENVFNDKTGLNIKFEYDSLESPREYNFETDRLFAKISYADAKKLYRYCDKAKLQENIGNRFTSYDGFISGYPNRLEAWQQKPVLHWDHNELGTLLICAIAMNTDFDEQVSQAVIDALQDEYGNGRGPNIDNAEFITPYARTHCTDKLARLEALLEPEFERARA